MTRRANRNGAVIVAMCDGPSMTSSLLYGRAACTLSQSQFLRPR